MASTKLNRQCPGRYDYLKVKGITVFVSLICLATAQQKAVLRREEDDLDVRVRAMRDFLIIGSVKA